MDLLTNILTRLDDFMYYPVLIIVMAIAGIYFTILTRGVQIRLFKEACRLVMEPSAEARKDILISGSDGVYGIQSGHGKYHRRVYSHMPRRFGSVFLDVADVRYRRGIGTYAVGFNLLCAYNLQSTFMVYDFYDSTWTPVIVGGLQQISPWAA